MNYDDIKKKLGIKVLPNQTPIVKVVEEEKLVEPAKPDTSSPIKIDQFKAQTQTSIKVEEEKVVEPSKSGAPSSSPSIDPNAPASSLPEGWTEHTDPASGNTYYHNASIRISQWEFPNAASVSAHKPKTSVKLLLGISFICVICVIFFINYISSPSQSDLIKEEKYVADSTRIADSIRFADSVAAEKYLKKFLNGSVKKNLNVSKYRNGDAIPQVQDAEEWKTLTTGAWCYYDNNASNGTKYGKLYNWYAVNDPRGLAPIGYHIPTFKECGELYYYNSNFQGLPGGYRDGSKSYNQYTDVGDIGYWWSSSEWKTLENNANQAWNINKEDNMFTERRTNGARSSSWGSINENDKRNGYSVLCLRDFDLTAAAARVADSTAAAAARIEDSLTRISASEQAAARVIDSTAAAAARVIDSTAAAAANIAARFADSVNLIKIGRAFFSKLDKKNLNVSKYRNGDVIPQVQNERVWANLSSGAWCYYENKTANGTTYGKLYNWYAVNDPRGLAPKGYHIPTNEEWTTLTNYLGGETIAGTKMKSKNGWKYNGNGTNTSGFAGLPGGFRNSNGSFEAIGGNGLWWSSSESYSYAWYRNLLSRNGNFYRDYNNKRNGFSVRCLRD